MTGPLEQIADRYPWESDNDNTENSSITAVGMIGGTDVTVQLQGYMAKAQAKSVPLVIPAAANGLPYKVSAILQAWAGARIIGQGAVLDFQTDHTATGRGLYIGNASTGVGVSDVRVIGLSIICSNATARNGVYGLFSIFGSSNVLLQDCSTGNSTANTGGESTGVFVSNTSNLRIVRHIVQNTLADGIHISRGSTNVVIDHPIVIGAQDDGIGVVSNRQDGSGPIYGPCQYVQIIQPVVRNSTVLGSGVSLVGAQDCTVVGGSVDTVPNRVFSISQANYGGIINPARNVVKGITGKNAAGASSFLVGNATDTVVADCLITASPNGGTVIGSTDTVVSGCRVSSTAAAQYGVYDDAASARTVVTGCNLHGNTSGGVLLQGTGSIQTGNITT